MSFSQEMKDFLGAWQSTSKMNTDAQYKDALTAASKGQEERASDEDTLALAQKQGEATLANTQARTAAIGRGLALRERQAAMLEKMANGSQGTGLLPGAAAGAAPAATPGALPSSTLQTEAYADGGLVADDDEDDTGPAVGGTSDTTDISAARRGGGLAPQLIDDGHSAVQAGYGYLHNSLGLSGGGLRTAAQKRAAMALQQGAGGLSPQEMDAARKAVDPQGQLSDSQRNMAALGSVYQFWQNKGEPEKAQRVAGQMLQHYRAATERYAAIAAHAAQGGDMPLAAKAAVMAYANVPDGKDFHIEASPDDPKRMIYYYTDDKGNELAKGIVTPQELASSAMGLASGGFDKALLTAAGQREEASKTKGAGPKPSDDIAVHKLFHDPNDGVMPQMRAQIEKANPAVKDDPNFENTFGDIGDLAQHVYKSNIGKATPREAATYAARLLTPGKADPEKADFKVEPGEDGVATLKFNDGGSLKIDDNELNKAMNIRAEKIKARVDKINADREADDKPSTMDRVRGAIGDITGGAAGAANDAGPRRIMAGAPRQVAPYTPPVTPAVPLTGGTVFPGGSRGAIPDG